MAQLTWPRQWPLSRRQTWVLAGVVILVVLAVLLIIKIARRPRAPEAAAEAGYQPGPGEVALFNGRDLTGWQVAEGDRGGFKVHDGVLSAEAGAGWLLTDKEYGDFELYLEYRLAQEGDSGVALRAPPAGNPTYAGLEVQLLDDRAFPDRHQDEYTGAIKDIVPPSRRADCPAGQWHRLRITASGRHVAVDVNGVRILDADLDGYMQHKDTHPGLGRRSGRLGLEGNKGRAEFRNLYVKLL